MLIPRRMLGFGFVLFLMLVMLAVIYSQFAMLKQPNPVDTTPRNSMGEMQKSSAQAPLPAKVTPETAADDLIDEALADRDDLSASEADEMADLESDN